MSGKVIFVDFETDGLDGRVEECACVSGNGACAHYPSLEALFESIPDDAVVIFWHQWHVLYLYSHYRTLLESLKGKYSVFMNAYAIMKQNDKDRYTIQEVTLDLCKRNHQGNALQDAIDLMECYHNLFKFKESNE